MVGDKMNRVNVQKGKAIEIESVFFERRVVLTTPSEKYMTASDANQIAENVFTSLCEEYGVLDADESWSIDTELFMKDVKSHVFAEIISVHESDKERKTGNDAGEVERITDAVNAVLPGEFSDTEAPDRIMSEGVAVEVIRMTLQSVFEELRGKQTHMRVESPFDFQTHGWGNEVTTDEVESLADVPVNDAVAGKVVSVFVIDGEVFKQPIVMPVPSNMYLTDEESMQVCENVFNWILEYGDEKIGVDGNNIQTMTFAAKLKQKIHDEWVDKDRKNTRSTVDAEDRFLTSVNSTFPKKDAYKKLPDDIYRVGVLVHITRGVMQTVFDKLCTWETNLRVCDPFTVEGRKWDDVYTEMKSVGENSESNTDDTDGVVINEFDFNTLNVNDVVELSSIKSTVFTVTRIEMDESLQTSSGTFKCDAFAYLSSDSGAVSNRVVVKNMTGALSVWRINNAGVADWDTVNRNVRIQI